jgi:hypothetical protein
LPLAVAQLDSLCLDLVWDDTEALYGDVHELKLKYYMLDDTADIFCVETKKFEKKYTDSRILVKRQKLMKETELSAPLQGLDSRLRLTSGNGSVGRHQAPKQQYVDCNAPGSFYHWSELLPGTWMNILGRKAQVVGFGNVVSERYYEKMMGSAVVHDVKSKYRFNTSKEIPTYDHVIPEHSGYGSFEDSMRSVRSIAPEAPPSRSGARNSLRFKLQFRGRLISATPSDASRDFIVTFFCEVKA